ncbi:MAG: hypothetical protein V2A54_16450 [Bacteroidota bacterium]
MKKSIKRVVIALNLHQLTSTELVSFLRAIIKAFNGNTYFTVAELAKLPVSLVDMGTQATNLENTHTSRKTNRSATLTSLEQEQATLIMNTISDTAYFVEGVANKKANGDLPLAVQIVTSAGFQVKKEFTPHQRSFEVIKIAEGMAQIRTKAVKTGVIYHWRWTTTPTDENSCKIIPPTIVSNITITGLPHATTVYFATAVTMPQGRKPVADSETYVPEWIDFISAIIL